MHRILVTLVSVATVLGWSLTAPVAIAQQSTLDLDRTPALRDAVADARRLGIATDVLQPEPGTLRLAIGPAFTTSSSTEYNLSRLYLAYAAYQRGHEGRIVLELQHGGEKIGEYDKSGLRLLHPLPTPPAAPAATDPTVATKPAQPPHGWYAALGIGSGSADFTCEQCVFERSPAVSGYAMLGRRLGERTVLGVEATGWQKSDETSRGRLYTIGAVALARFGGNLPLFLSGGIGYAGFRRRVPEGTVSADALGYTARLGADVRLTRQLHMAPYAGLVGSFGQPKFTYGDGSPYGLSANFSNLQLGVALVLD